LTYGATGPRIVVVDVEPLVRRALRTELTRQGSTVFETATGEEALRAVTQVHPDLVALEFVLPDLGAGPFGLIMNDNGDTR